MSDLTGRNRPFVNRKAQRGQALIIVLAVMFVLIFIGTIFIAQIARNIQQSGRSVQTQIANTLAEAGVRYCDEQLTHTGDGADWRPTPTPPNTLTDPDYQWLAVGFSRVSMNGGRALVRVVYAPDTSDPRGGLLRIESIGRPGDIGNGTDPTVFVQTGAAPRLRKELVAYKQIGLTDYARFVTNKNKTNTEAAFGAPSLGGSGIGAPLSMVLGDPAIGKTPNANYPSYPMRINGDVRFFGSTYLYESLRGTNDALLTADTLLASGNIAFDNSETRLFVNQDITGHVPARAASNVLPEVGPAGNVNCMANPTSANPDCGYDGKNGLVRIGSDQPDAKGYTQNIRSLAPPSLDYYDAGTGVLRYRLLTRETGAFTTDPNGQRFRAGQDGWGTGIYVNNPTDYQAETNNAGVGSAYSLRADWLNPNAQFSQNYWNGPYYRPPGVQIELLGDRIRLTRDDNDTFYEPDGSPSQAQGSKTIEIPLSDFGRKSYKLPDGMTLIEKKQPSLSAFPHDGDEKDTDLAKFGLSNPYTHKDTYGVNVVLMAEGNVRVRGVFGVDASNVTESDDPAANGSTKLERVHLTIVSGRTAYIEGNIVKGDPDKASTCAILAHDYICVNPTLFMAPQNQTNAWTRYPQNLDSFVEEVGPGLATPSFDANFSFGLNPIEAYGNTPINLLVRQASYHGAPTLMNLRINSALSLGSPGDVNGRGFYDFTKSFFDPKFPTVTDATVVNTFLPDGTPSVARQVFAETYSLGYTYLGDSGFAKLPKFEARSFALNPSPTNPSYFLNTQAGYENLLSFSVDATTAGQAGTSSLLAGATDNYAFGGAMVTPLDIRIEAVLYAQERSFFVIPGYTFNPDKTDTLAAYLYSGSRPVTYTNGPVNAPLPVSRVAPNFPFYNEPLDVRITVFGSITENYTASINDQAAWMARWGYIPVNSGASSQTGQTPTPIPDIHIKGIDPNTPAVAVADYRTLDEQNAFGQNQGIARGMRFLYDPAMAFPYAPYVRALNPPNDMPGNPIGVDLTSPKFLPLRFIPYTLKDLTGNALPGGVIRLTLPPVPKLPVCPGLLYMGTPDRPLG